MVDKNFCMSSYLAFRYIEKDDVDFFETTKHSKYELISEKERKSVYSASDIDMAIAEQISKFRDKKKGILLSGGMDSAIVASYLSGSEAYTFRFLDGDYQSEELGRAEFYAGKYSLNLHYVDISWQTVEKYLDACMLSKGAPVHSIEPQILQAALQAKEDGVEIMFVGESSDLVFGGMDKLLSKNWKFDEFVNRYTFLEPKAVLKEPVSMSYLYERYREGEDSIDFMKFMDDVFANESSASYYNAFLVAQMPYYDPYARLKMGNKLDLQRVRNGESKYLIRELMKMKYPEIAVPEKNPMPRPVDYYFSDWDGPKRPEFRDDIDMKTLTGNQKWQLFCLERFLNLYENK